MRRLPVRFPDPPACAGVRRSFVGARGVRFHVSEAGPADGRPVVLLHGWPQHHWTWRDLLADPPPGLRVIAPDLPGYGWSGPAPHRWAKDEVAADVLALIAELGLERTLLVGHDWGGFVSHLVCLEAPELIDGHLVLNVGHPWNTLRTVAPHLWRMLLYQPPIAAFGAALTMRTGFIERGPLRVGVGDRTAISPEDVAIFADRFRDPVCARAAQDTYRTFLLREMPQRARRAETRRCCVPTRCVFGLDDFAVHPSLAAAETANADDYTFEAVPGCGHFIADERPAIVRDRLEALAAEVPAGTGGTLSPDRG